MVAACHDQSIRSQRPSWSGANQARIEKVERTLLRITCIGTRWICVKSMRPPRVDVDSIGSTSLLEKTCQHIRFVDADHGICVTMKDQRGLQTLNAVAQGRWHAPVYRNDGANLTIESSGTYRDKPSVRKAE